MTIDSNYILMPALQQVIHDKLDGSLLAAGKVWFYKDNSRDDLKSIFMLTGSPPDYSYAVLPNPLILSSIGSYVDPDGNNIIPLLYPYDENGNVELYYIVVESADGVSQFTFQGMPLIAGGGDGDTGGDISYVPNGQFLLHNYISKTGLLDNSAIINVAYGGWTFERPDATTSQDVITFERYGSPITTPTGDPRYAIRIKSEIPNVGDEYKKFCLEFKDVNKFSSDTQYYTYSFYAKSESAPIQALVSILKHYGAGGSPDDTIDAQSIVITPTGGMFNIPLLFGTNDGKTIGDGDDDYIKIQIELPATYEFDVLFTDVSFLRNKVIVNEYPLETVSQVIYKSLAGFIPIPDYEGANVGLPLLLTKTGIDFDRKHIGKLYIYSAEALNTYGVLKADGATYDASAYSSEGIPYKRLGDHYTLTLPQFWGQPLYGTGADFCTAEGAVDTTLVYITVNDQLNTYLHAQDGAIPTGFTFSTDIILHPGWTVSKIIVHDASLITAGSFFEFYDKHSNKYIAWYKKDGSGTQPTTPAYKYIEIDIEGTNVAANISHRTYIAINHAYFAVPDYRGKFLRVTADGSANDPNRTTRTSSTSYDQTGLIFGATGDTAGTNQADEFKSHSHQIPDASTSGGDGSFGRTTMDYVGNNQTKLTGGLETRPINQYVNVFIGY